MSQAEPASLISPSLALVPTPRCPQAPVPSLNGEVPFGEPVMGKHKVLSVQT